MPLEEQEAAKECRARKEADRAGVRGAKGRRADMKRHPHAWRHGFAINLIMQGKPLEVVKELLGHASILTTHVYSRALAANVRPFMETAEF